MKVLSDALEAKKWEILGLMQSYFLSQTSSKSTGIGQDDFGQSRIRVGFGTVKFHVKSPPPSRPHYSRAGPTSEARGVRSPGSDTRIYSASSTDKRCVE